MLVRSKHIWSVQCASMVLWANEQASSKRWDKGPIWYGLFQSIDVWGAIWAFKRNETWLAAWLVPINCQGKKKPRCRLTCCYELTRGFKKKKSQGPYRLKKKRSQVAWLLAINWCMRCHLSLKNLICSYQLSRSFKKKRSQVPHDCLPSTDVSGAIWALKGL